MAQGITHCHCKIKTERRGRDILLWGTYKDCYGKEQKELLWVNPAQAMIDGCKAALKDGAVDLRRVGPPELEYEQYHQTGMKKGQ